MRRKPFTRKLMPLEEDDQIAGHYCPVMNAWLPAVFAHLCPPYYQWHNNPPYRHEHILSFNFQLIETPNKQIVSGTSLWSYAYSVCHSRLNRSKVNRHCNCGCPVQYSRVERRPVGRASLHTDSTSINPLFGAAGQ